MLLTRKHSAVVTYRNQKPTMISKRPICRNIIVASMENLSKDTTWKSKIRILEVASGRSALIGLFVGNVHTLVTHQSFLTQGVQEWRVIGAMYFLILLLTHKQFNGAVEKTDVKYELNGYRLSMVVMTLLLFIEIFELTKI